MSRQKIYLQQDQTKTVKKMPGPICSNAQKEKKRCKTNFPKVGTLRIPKQHNSFITLMESTNKKSQNPYPQSISQKSEAHGILFIRSNG